MATRPARECQTSHRRGAAEQIRVGGGAAADVRGQAAASGPTDRLGVENNSKNDARIDAFGLLDSAAGRTLAPAPEHMHH